MLRQELGVLQGHLKGKDHVHDDGGGLGDAINGDVVDFPHLVLSGELEHLRILALAAEKASHPHLKVRVELLRSRFWTSFLFKGSEASEDRSIDPLLTV